VNGFEFLFPSAFGGRTIVRRDAHPRAAPNRAIRSL
jgi:hypothetical protein